MSRRDPGDSEIMAYIGAVFLIGVATGYVLGVLVSLIP